jgi:hypothetical protein
MLDWVLGVEFIVIILFCEIGGSMIFSPRNGVNWQIFQQKMWLLLLFGRMKAIFILCMVQMKDRVE